MSLAEHLHPASPRFESAEAFLAWAEAQPERWELVDGVARMMTGGSVNHGRIAGNAFFALRTGLREGPCEAFGSDVAVIVGPSKVVYPDASVSCEPEEGMGVTRPVVVVEVLSPSTASYDLTHKATIYRRLPSLRHLVFIHQDRIGVQHFHRDAEGRDFTLTDLGRVNDVLALAAIGVEVTVAALYAQVPLTG